MDTEAHAFYISSCTFFSSYDVSNQIAPSICYCFSPSVKSIVKRQSKTFANLWSRQILWHWKAQYQEFLCEVGKLRRCQTPESQSQRWLEGSHVLSGAYFWKMPGHKQTGDLQKKINLAVWVEKAQRETFSTESVKQTQVATPGSSHFLQMIAPKTWAHKHKLTN